MGPTRGQGGGEAWVDAVPVLSAESSTSMASLSVAVCALV